MSTILTAEHPSVNLEIVIDPYINEQAKLSRPDFLERISNVKSIRTRELQLSFYLSDIKKLIRLENLHNIVNTGNFKGQTLRDDKLFAIGLPKKFFNWLRNTTATTLHRQILHWHAAYYAFNSFHEFAEEEFDPLVLDEVKQILKQYYPENFKAKFNIEDIEEEDEYKMKRDFALQYYIDISEKYTGSLPPEFLKNPYREPLSNLKEGDYDWGLMPDCKFSILLSYFNELDWIIIVERSKDKLKEFHKGSYERKQITDKDIAEMIAKADEDTLQRAEAVSGMWNKWKYTFQNFETRREFTYSIIPKSETRGGFVYLQQDETRATKIGWTKKSGLERKIGNQTGNPTNLTERGKFNASSKKTEDVLHQMFKDKQTRDSGEWFWLTEEDIQNILDSNWRMQNNIF